MINKEAVTAQIEIRGICLHNPFGWLMEKTGEKDEKLLQTLIQERGQTSLQHSNYPCCNTAQADLVKSEKDFWLHSGSLTEHTCLNRLDHHK